MLDRPRAYAYIDGFNLYYGLLKRQIGVARGHTKWLDIPRWLRLVAKNVDLLHVRYFTASITSPPHDPDRSERQDRYLRALAALPDVTIHLGHFLEKTVRVPLADTWPHEPQFVRVRLPEEKGSDVNLAVFLLLNAFDDRFDIAIVVSNDSDLTTAIEVVTRRFQKQVWVFSPYKRVSYALRKVASHYRVLRLGPVLASQFPPVVRDAQGNEIMKPLSW
ncbi:MAG TPA: NYN domain-containing protein [Dehalococcoidia bacterium]|nr:NYN domain-containing protein [Dehalococcoidia bacterium]